MNIIKVSKNYLVKLDDSLKSALLKIDENKARIVFVVDDAGIAQGAISDGDIRRYLLKSNNNGLASQCTDVMNVDFKSHNKSSNLKKLKNSYVNGIDCIPILDNLGRIIELSFDDLKGFKIGNKDISDKSSSYIIAEIGNNHQGEINLAKKLVDFAIDAGADCAKFQMRDMSTLYVESVNTESSDLGSEYTLDLLSKFQLTNDELFEVFDYCYKKNITPLCTPWDLTSLKALELYGMEAYKIASADYTNYELLDAVCETGKPFICSTGMSTEKEIISTSQYLDTKGANFILLHCNSTYPTPFRDVNLNYLNRIRKLTKKLVGYSGHERGISVPIAAVALGAAVIEKHITTNKELLGTDHKVSLLPDEFKQMVSQIRDVEDSLSLGNNPREISQGEMINRETLAKSLVANQDISKGIKISRDMISIKSPGKGIQPNLINELIGIKSIRDIKKNDFFYLSDIHGPVSKKRSYKFKRPYGVPVRFHDYEEIVQDIDLDFVEFHLSYKDLSLDIDNYISKNQDMSFAVHSPELFEDDHIMDLCSFDDAYRSKSISLLNNVIDKTNKLKVYFNKTKCPVVVVNAGGWERSSFINNDEKNKKYSLLQESLKEIELNSIQIAIQTMPPFPWHFGGQSFHNLFVCADEIVNFCEKNPEIKICLDISHTMMACNYYGWDFIDYIKKISPYVVHLHVVDAKGTDGEGVEIGKGDVNFKELFKVLKKHQKNIQFIPEIWQGHNNKGEGFWNALNFLDGKF